MGVEFPLFKVSILVRPDLMTYQLPQLTDGKMELWLEPCTIGCVVQDEWRVGRNIIDTVNDNEDGVVLSAWF